MNMGTVHPKRATVAAVVLKYEVLARLRSRHLEFGCHEAHELRFRPDVRDLHCTSCEPTASTASAFTTPGTPAINVRAATERTTQAPAAIVAPAPMRSGSPSLPLITVAPAPINTPGPICTCPATCTPGDSDEKSPTVTSCDTVLPTLMWTCRPMSTFVVTTTPAHRTEPTPTFTESDRSTRGCTNVAAIAPRSAIASAIR